MNVEVIEKSLSEFTETVQAGLEKNEAAVSKLDDTTTELADRVHTLEQKQFGILSDASKRPEFMITKVVRHLSDPSNNVLDGFERETHEELKGKLPPPHPGAVWVPLTTKDVDYSAGSPSAAGSNLVPQQLFPQLIDVLRQESVVLGLNPLMISASGDLDVPKKSTDSTAYWFAGDGADSITESNPTFSQVQLRPKFCAGLVTATYRMLIQTGGNVERIIRNDLAGVLAEEIDRAALQGSGTGSEPTGILNTAGINSDLWNGSPAAISWDDVVECERLLIEDKALRGSLAYLADDATYKSLKTTTKVSADAGAGFLADDGTLNGYPLTATTHMPANTLLFGNFSDLVVAEWGALALASDPYGSNFAKGSVAIRAILPIDFAVRHAVSFCKSSAS